MPGGFASTSELARVCGIHRTTTKRLLETLRAEGLVRTGARDGEYHLTQDVRQLSEGFRNQQWIAEVASPAMCTSVRELLWPCDLGALEGGFMVVRESTHRFSLLSQHRGMIGEKLPLFFTAMGRAYLAACTDKERDGLLTLLSQRDDVVGEMAREPARVDALIAQTRARGYAVNDGDWNREATTAAIAVPVVCGTKLVGGINLIFPRAAVSATELEDRYLPRLKRLAYRIGKDMQPWLQADDEAALS